MGKFLNLIIGSCILASLMVGCGLSNEKEIYQSNRNEVVKVKSAIKEIVKDEVLIGSLVRMEMLNDYLLIKDAKSYDTLIHIFDKKTFKHIRGVGLHGPGPDEITNMGRIVPDDKNRIFHVSDLGKNKIFAYEMDSVVTNPNYKPTLLCTINDSQFPDDYVYISDTLAIARVIKILPNEPFQQTLAYWNMKTGSMTPMSYSHPEIERKRVRFNASQEKDVIVEAYSHHDLITVCDFEGNLKCNIYGPRWDNSTSNKMNYFETVHFYKDMIAIAYSGKDNFSKDYLPTCIMFFDLKGNYLKTLDVEYKFQDFCVDEDNDRLIFAFSDEIQFGYLDLKGLI
jgi:hypothetical protein